MSETIPMGIGQLGFNNLIFKRKFRFTFELQDICGQKKVPRHFVKVAAKPSLTIEDTEVNYLNARTWVPGKGSWESITVSYLDVATVDAEPLYSWLASVYNFTDPVKLQQGSKRADYAATAILKTWDGCGQLIDIWTMKDVWPTSVNFGDTDYGNSDISEIELTLRYSEAKYKPICPDFKIEPCCSPCDGRPNQPTTSVSRT